MIRAPRSPSMGEGDRARSGPTTQRDLTGRQRSRAHDPRRASEVPAGPVRACRAADGRRRRGLCAGRSVPTAPQTAGTDQVPGAGTPSGTSMLGRGTPIIGTRSRSDPCASTSRSSVLDSIGTHATLDPPCRHRRGARLPEEHMPAVASLNRLRARTRPNTVLERLSFAVRRYGIQNPQPVSRIGPARTPLPGPGAALRRRSARRARS